MNPYPSYKDSKMEWIGEIPSKWEVKSIKYISGYNLESLGSDTKPDYELDYLEISDVNSGGEINEPTHYEFSKSPSRCRRIVKQNDIIISTVRTYLKSIGFIENDVTDLICSTGFCVLSPNDVIKPKLLFYLVRSEWFISNVISQSIGVSYPGIQTEKLMSIKVLLPPTNEQSQIVSFLDTKTQKIDELIEKTEQKIELLKEKRTSLINHCVTKGLNPNVEMKDSGVEWIGEIPSHWIRTKMKYVVHIFGRIGYRGYTTEDIVNEGEGVITISPSNIREDKFSTENSTYLSWEKYHESPEIQIFTNDIILVKTGSTIGKTSIIPNNVPEMTINPQLVVLKNIRLFPKYLYYQTTCRFIKESFDIEQTGSSTPTISQEKMNEFPILNPSNDEQIQIVEYLDEQTQKIDSTIEKETQRIELLKEYRQSLISEVVTGKVDVRDYNG